MMVQRMSTHTNTHTPHPRQGGRGPLLNGRLACGRSIRFAFDEQQTANVGIGPFIDIGTGTHFAFPSNLAKSKVIELPLEGSELFCGRGERKAKELMSERSVREGAYRWKGRGRTSISSCAPVRTLEWRKYLCKTSDSNRSG